MSDWQWAYLAGVLDEALTIQHTHRVAKASIAVAIRLNETLGVINKTTNLFGLSVSCRNVKDEHDSIKYQYLADADCAEHSMPQHITLQRLL